MNACCHGDVKKAAKKNGPRSLLFCEDLGTHIFVHQGMKSWDSHIPIPINHWLVAAPRGGNSQALGPAMRAEFVQTLRFWTSFQAHIQPMPQTSPSWHQKWMANSLHGQDSHLGPSSPRSRDRGRSLQASKHLLNVPDPSLVSCQACTYTFIVGSWAVSSSDMLSSPRSGPAQ